MRAAIGLDGVIQHSGRAVGAGLRTYRGGKGRMHMLMARIQTVLNREDGQGAVEYALVVLGVALVIAAAVAGFTDYIGDFMAAAGAKLQDYIPS